MVEKMADGEGRRRGDVGEGLIGGGARLIGGEVGSDDEALLAGPVVVCQSNEKRAIQRQMAMDR